MNIYELEKMATPGPFTADNRAVYSGNDQIASVTWEENRDEEFAATAALLAHCRNNFMKALEALKEEHARCMKAYDKLGEIHPEHYEIISMIEKMEKV